MALSVWAGVFLSCSVALAVGGDAVYQAQPFAAYASWALSLIFVVTASAFAAVVGIRGYRKRRRNIKLAGLLEAGSQLQDERPRDHGSYETWKQSIKAWGDLVEAQLDAVECALVFTTVGDMSTHYIEIISNEHNQELLKLDGILSALREIIRK